MKAVVSTGEKTVTLRDVPILTPGPHQILVKVIAVAINPIDAKKARFPVPDGVVEGCDYAGVVEEVGSQVPANLAKKGDRVAGFLHGGVTFEFGGAFAEYCIVDPHHAIHIPDYVSYEEASTLGISGITAAQILFQKNPHATVQTPLKSPEPILVWGGATALGMYTIQLAKLAGYEVIATASPKNFDFVKSFGASAVFDYRDPQVVQKIKEYTNDNLGFVVDTITLQHSIKPATDAISSKGGVASIIMKVDHDGWALRKDIRYDYFLVFMLFEKAFVLPNQQPAVPGYYKDGVSYVRLFEQLLKEKKIKFPPTEIVPNGLASLEDSFTRLREGRVSASKLVHRIADTPAL